MNVSLELGAIPSLMPLMVSVDPADMIANGFTEQSIFVTVLFTVVLTLLGMLLYVAYRERASALKTKKDLQYMARYGHYFEWSKIQLHVKNCFYNIHLAWGDADLASVSELMTDDHTLNQQRIYLDQCKCKGMFHTNSIHKVLLIQPLLFVHKNPLDNYNGSELVVLITADMLNYLSIESGEPDIDGAQRFKNTETIWTFLLQDGLWKLSGIEDSQLSLIYARLAREMPSLESLKNANR